MDKVYKCNPEMIYTSKEGVLKLVFLDEQKNHFIVLKGAASAALPLFDGIKDLRSIKKELDQKFNITKNDDPGFGKMVDFLLKNEIIVEA